MSDFQPLFDISGVDGSFAIDATGQVVGAQTQSYISESMVAASARAVVTYFNLLDDGFEHCDDLTLRYATLSIMAKRSSSLIICAVVREPVNAGLVRMGSVAVAKNVLATQSASTRAASTTLATPATPASAGPPAKDLAPAKPKQPLPPKKKGSIWG